MENIGQSEHTLRENDRFTARGPHIDIIDALNQ